MSAQWEAQVALYDALMANSTFTTLISSRLYDEPPTNSAYPYVVIGNTTEITDNRLNYNGFDVTITFDIFTKPGGLGFWQAKKILEAMNTVLNVKKMSMSNYTMLICQFVNSITDRDDDIRIISARYRVLCHSDTAISFT
jgi:hypothetical protein